MCSLIILMITLNYSVKLCISNVTDQNQAPFIQLSVSGMTKLLLPAECRAQYRTHRCSAHMRLKEVITC